MSDGISDAYKQEREDQAHAQQLMAIATHLVVKTQDTLERVWWEHTHSKDLLKVELKLTQLMEGNRGAWGRFLLDCKENYTPAFERARSIAPFSKLLKIHEIKFDYWSEEGKFWRPFFHAAGLATDRGNGYRDGYDVYMILYDESMTLEQIAKTAVWTGFKTTGWDPTHNTEVPTSPLLKDRVKRG